MNSFKALYYAHVRSHLEYCCEVWTSEKITYSEELEKVQWIFVRYLYHKNLVPGYSPFIHDPYIIGVGENGRFQWGPIF